MHDVLLYTGYYLQCKIFTIFSIWVYLWCNNFTICFFPYRLRCQINISCCKCSLLKGYSENNENVTPVNNFQNTVVYHCNNIDPPPLPPYPCAIATKFSWN